MGSDFEQSYLGRLRKLVGSRLLQVPGFRAVVVNEAGEILLIKRTDNGFWGMPAGSPEEGESIQACVLREVREETGLHLRSFECFGFSSDPSVEIFRYPNGDQMHSFSLLVSSGDWQGVLAHGNDEAAAARFFARGALPEMLPNERRSLERYFAFRESGRFQLS